MATDGFSLGDAATWYAAIVATLALGWQVVRELNIRPRLHLAIETERYDDNPDAKSTGVSVVLVITNVGEITVNVTEVYLVTEDAIAWSAEWLRRGVGFIEPLERREILRADLSDVLGWVKESGGGHLDHVTVVDSTGKRRRLMLSPEWSVPPEAAPAPVVQGSWLHRGRRWLRRRLRRPPPRPLPERLP
jgi:hypothetical protein